MKIYRAQTPQYLALSKISAKRAHPGYGGGGGGKGTSPRPCKNKSQQECIPIGCVPPAAVAISGGLHTHPHPCDQAPPPLWTETLIHATENITLPQTSFAGGKKDGRQRQLHRFHVSRPPYPTAGSVTVELHTL